MTHPTYEQVKAGGTGYAEACKVEYDPQVISLRTLLRHYLRIIDPTTLNRQGPDIGAQYRTSIYYNDDGERRLAEELLAKEQKNWDDPVVTTVEPLVNFYAAEEYHQDYLKRGRAATATSTSPCSTSRCRPRTTEPRFAAASLEF